MVSWTATVFLLIIRLIEMVPEDGVKFLSRFLVFKRFLHHLFILLLKKLLGLPEVSVTHTQNIFSSWFDIRLTLIAHVC